MSASTHPKNKKPTIAIKLHAHPEEGEVLAVADFNLVGKTIEEGKLSLTITTRFYHEELVSEEELQEKLNESGNINLVGTHAFAVAQKMGLVTEKGMKRIAGIPYACIYKV